MRRTTQIEIRMIEMVMTPTVVNDGLQSSAGNSGITYAMLSQPPLFKGTDILTFR